MPKLLPQLDQEQHNVLEEEARSLSWSRASAIDEDDLEEEERFSSSSGFIFKIREECDTARVSENVAADSVCSFHLKNLLQFSSLCLLLLISCLFTHLPFHPFFVFLSS